jgi:excisionase family DNA binding protein
MNSPEREQPRDAAAPDAGGAEGGHGVAGRGSAVDPLLVSSQELAALLGVSVRHLAGLRSSGRLPSPIRLGRSIRWDREEITDWIAARCPSRDQWEIRAGRGAKS